MNVYEEPQEGAGAPKAPRPNPVGEFRAMPGAERWLAAFAAAVIAAYLIRGFTGEWKGDLFDVCALAGAVAVLGLVAPQLFGVRVFSARIRMYAFAVAGIFPAVGFVMDLLTSDIWKAAMLAGSVAMGLTAWQIAERERLLR